MTTDIVTENEKKHKVELVDFLVTECESYKGVVPGICGSEILGAFLFNSI